MQRVDGYVGLVAVEVDVLQIKAKLRRHEVRDKRLERLPLNVLPQSVLRDFPRQTRRGTLGFDLRRADARPVSVVRVLRLLAENPSGDADFVNFALPAFPHFVAHQRAQLRGVERLPDEPLRLFRVQQAGRQRSRLNRSGVSDNLFVALRHFVSPLSSHHRMPWR